MHPWLVFKSDAAAFYTAVLDSDFDDTCDDRIFQEIEAHGSVGLHSDASSNPSRKELLCGSNRLLDPLGPSNPDDGPGADFPRRPG